MARVSFGSRAGGTTDYLSGNNGPLHFRQSNINGVYGSLQELTSALRGEIDECAKSEVPDLTTCELSISEDATLPLLRPAIGPYADGGEHDLPPEYKIDWTVGDEGFPGLDMALPRAAVSLILAAGVGQPRQIVQRAASRAIVQSLEATDGFKYSFNNAWSAKDEEGLRYSYICQDSMQNKDRHANGFTKTQKHLKGEGERGPRKPTYDCKGSISVKFSAIRRRIDVYYRHYAIHSSVADRKAPARPLPKFRAPRPAVERITEPAPPPPDTGGLFGTLQNETSAFEDTGFNPPISAPHRADLPKAARPQKRKRDSDLHAPPDPSKPLSLVELLRQSESAASPASSQKEQPKPSVNSNVPPPVDYNLPSWQAPPPPPPAPAQQYQPKQAQQGQYGSYGAPYPPPYQPQNYQSSTTQPPSNRVAIPRQSQLVPQQQQFLGAPKGQHPQSQGLFSTLKPVRKEDYTAYEPHFVIYQSHRAKSSCTNCRISKKKVSSSLWIASARPS